MAVTPNRTPMKLFGAVFRRIILPASSQILASVATLVLSVFAASSFDTESFGVLGLLVAGQAIVLGCSRSLTSEIIVYHYSSAGTRKLTRRIDESTGAVFVWGILASAATTCLAYLLPDVRGNLLVFALTLPGMFLQDHFRQCLISCRRGGTALVVDCGFVVMLVVSLVLIRPADLSTFLGVWGAVAAGAALFGGLALGVQPKFSAALPWIRKEIFHGKYFLGDFLTTNLIAQGAIYLVAFVGGLSEAAALRGAQVLLVPILLVTRGLLIALGPESASKARQGNSRALIILCAGYSIACAFTCIFALAAVACVPDEALSIVLGDSASSAKEVFPAAAIATAMLGVAGGGALGLRALGDVRQALVMKLWSVPIAAAGVIGGCLSGGAMGSQFGLAAGESLRTVLNWLGFSRALRNGVGIVVS